MFPLHFDEKECSTKVSNKRTDEPSTPPASPYSRAGVQKACSNCKRSHLSCSHSRPCTRCVLSGKEESCQDAVHKRRGRPRINDSRHDSMINEYSMDGLASLSQTINIPAEPLQAASRPSSPSRDMFLDVSQTAGAGSRRNPFNLENLLAS